MFILISFDPARRWFQKNMVLYLGSYPNSFSLNLEKVLALFLELVAACSYTQHREQLEHLECLKLWSAFYFDKEPNEKQFPRGWSQMRKYQLFQYIAEQRLLRVPSIGTYQFFQSYNFEVLWSIQNLQA